MATVRGALAIYDGMSGPIHKIHEAMNTLINTFENDLGYNFGEGIEDTVSGMFKMPTLDEMGFDDFGNNLEGIYGNTGDTAANTAATADAIEYTDEDLKYLRDIAEREAINRYTTAQITVEQHNENHISKDTDLDGIMEAWTADFAEKLDISGEGV